MSDCDLCAWMDSLEFEPGDWKIPTAEERERFANTDWKIDLHDCTRNTLEVEAAADHIAERLEGH